MIPTIKYTTILNDVCKYRLTWLKRRLSHLGLHRRGVKVQYTAVSAVQEAIEVSYQDACSYTTTKLPTGRTARMQQQNRVQADVDGT